MSRPKPIFQEAVRRLLILGLCTGSLLLTTRAAAEEIRYVIDGDTVVLTSGVRVRLIGIDAPEVDHPEFGRKGEPYGPEATEYLKKLLAGKSVRLESGTEPKDKYGRTLAYLFLPNGLFVNQEMVRAGFAETFRRFDFVYKEDFLKLEAEARKAKRGMWQQEQPDHWQKQFLHWLSSSNKRKATVSLTDT